MSIFTKKGKAELLAQNDAMMNTLQQLSSIIAAEFPTQACRVWDASIHLGKMSALLAERPTQ